MNYTERVDGFQITDPSFLPGHEPKVPSLQYDIVKWEQDEPFEAYDMNTGEKKICTEYCYVVAVLKWDCKEPAMDFRSIGMRWFEANPTPAAIEMVNKFVEEKSRELDEINDELIKQRTWRGSSDYSVCPYCGKQNSGLSYKFCPHCGRRVFS